MSTIEVLSTRGAAVREPLRLLEEGLRDGEPLPEGFLAGIQDHVAAGDLEVLAARLDNRTLGVLVLAFRPNVSLAGRFASIEDLYVAPEARRRGAGRALLQAAHERCEERGISYLEAQVEGNGAREFYAASGYEPEPGVRVFSRSLPLDERGNAKPKAGG